MRQSCEIVFPIITILGDIKAHRMTCPSLKIMSAPELEPMAYGLSDSYNGKTQMSLSFRRPRSIPEWGLYGPLHPLQTTQGREMK